MIIVEMGNMDHSLDLLTLHETHFFFKMVNMDILGSAKYFLGKIVKGEEKYEEHENWRKNLYFL